MPVNSKKLALNLSLFFGLQPRYAWNSDPSLTKTVRFTTVRVPDLWAYVPYTCMGTNSMKTKVDHLVFLKTSMLKERALFWKFLPWDSLLILLDFLDFAGIFQYKKLPFLLYTSQAYFFSHNSQSFRSLVLEGVTTVVDCIKCVPMPVIKQDEPPSWGAENRNDPPLIKGSKTDNCVQTSHEMRLVYFPVSSVRNYARLSDDEGGA